MTGLPTLIPTTIPEAAFTVASAVLPDVQVPFGVTSARVTEFSLPEQTWELPEIAAGRGLTVSTMVL